MVFFCFLTKASAASTYNSSQVSKNNNLMPPEAGQPNLKAFSEWRKSNAKGPGRSITFPSFYKPIASLSLKDSLLLRWSYFPPWGKSVTSTSSLMTAETGSPTRSCTRILRDSDRYTCPATFWLMLSQEVQGRVTACVFWKWLPTRFWYTHVVENSLS